MCIQLLHYSTLEFKSTGHLPCGHHPSSYESYNKVSVKHAPFLVRLVLTKASLAIGEIDSTYYWGIGKIAMPGALRYMLKHLTNV